MVKLVKLKYVNAFNSKGKTYYYFRRQGRCKQLVGEPGGAEFMAQYARLLGESESPRGPSLARGTLRWLIADYKSGAKFTRLAAKTQRGYARMLDILKHVDLFQASEIKRIHLHELRKQFLNTPRTADEFAKVASLLCSRDRPHRAQSGRKDPTP